MNDSFVCKRSPVKTLSVSAAPLRELLNFLIYGQHAGLFTERARRQPVLELMQIPATARELKEILKAEKCDKKRKNIF